MPSNSTMNPSAFRTDEVYVDKELGSEAVTYVLESGVEGTVSLRLPDNAR